MLEKLRSFKQIAKLGSSAALTSTLLISSATPSLAAQLDCGTYTCTLFLSRSEVRTIANTGEIGLISTGISALYPIGTLLGLAGAVFYNYASSAARQNKCLRIPYTKPNVFGTGSPLTILGFYPYDGLPPAGGVRCQEVL